MSDRLLKILLIDPDPIFRLGLRVALETNPYLQVVADVETDTAALQILVEIAQQDPNQVNLVILELGNNHLTNRQQLGWQFCRQLRALYPNLPILLLSSISQPGLLLAARASGVNGYCPKGIPVSELVDAIQEVADGGSYWFGERDGQSMQRWGNFSALSSQNSQLRTLDLGLFRLRNNLRLSGISQIDAALAAVMAQLQMPGLPLLDRAVLAGQQRELLAARWLLTRLLATPHPRQQEYQPSPAISSFGSAIAKSDSQQIETSPPLLTPRALQSALFASCITKLQFPLQNVTDIPLEIDILREDKKRELLYLILQKLAQQLDELRVSQIESEELFDLINKILSALWQAAITDFFGKFVRVKVGNQNIEIVNFLLQNTEPVQADILYKTPLVFDLFSYLLFQTDLQIDNTSYPAGSTEAKSQALIILENLLIQIGNGVVQPLLNSLADVETIKRNFYDRQLISTREVERFRNNLSWKYRWRNYVTEAQAIFESRYELFVFAPRGIAKISIYAPRNQELAQLSNIPLAVTLLLEFRDAIAPRLQSLLAFVGSGIVFVLTQVIGRGLGLIGRGILQGIGSVSLTEKSLRKNSEHFRRTVGNRTK